MTTQLREELDALAHTQTFSPDPAAWDRGRRARRRSQATRGAAVLAVVALVVGAGALALRPDRQRAQPAEVPGGAIPSVVPEPTGQTLTNLAIGRASVAYLDSEDTPVLVDATTGEAHRVTLPDFPDPATFDTAVHRRGWWLALSPDGTRLTYPTASRTERDPGEYSVYVAWFRVVDLSTGESDLVELPPYGSTPLALTWTADGQLALDAYDKGRLDRPLPDVIGWTIDPATGEAARKPLIGVTAPGGGLSATFPGPDTALEVPDPSVFTDPVDAVRFVTPSGTELERALPTDRYPDGAVVWPIGWAEDSLLVARVGGDLVLLTSPDRPESEWVWRPLVEDLPDGAEASIAVDLVPDLTGDPAQELTHDFGD